MIYSLQGEAIEGASCWIDGKKQVPINTDFPIMIDEDEPEPCIRYSLSRNSSAKITKVLNLSPEELEIRIKRGIHLNLNDELKAEKIYAYLKAERNIRFKLLGGFTHRHKSNGIDTKCQTFCEIATPIDGVYHSIMKRIEQQKQLKQNI